MHFAGILPADAPDPRLEIAEMLKAVPIPIIEFVEQRSLEITDTGIYYATDAAGYSAMTASVSATLWRNPDNKSDPVNLAELDEETRRAVEGVPLWPRPGWLIERVERMRYPILCEAVQTTWNREESEYTTLEYLLVHHTNDILMNHVREELQLGLHDWDSPALTSERTVRHGVSVVIDGETVTGAEIDTDPFVYAIGAKLANGGILTAVIPREHLAYIDLTFARRGCSGAICSRPGPEPRQRPPPVQRAAGWDVPRRTNPAQLIFGMLPVFVSDLDGGES
jgi:hypothetical protein